MFKFNRKKNVLLATEPTNFWFICDQKCYVYVVLSFNTILLLFYLKIFQIKYL